MHSGAMKDGQINKMLIYPYGQKAVLSLCMLAVTINNIYEHELKMEAISGSD